MTDATRWIVDFYVDARGESPVMSFMEGLQAKARASLARVIALLQRYGPFLHMPHARQIDGELWELRGGSGRLFYFSFVGRRFVILSGYRKKSKKKHQRKRLHWRGGD